MRSNIILVEEKKGSWFVTSLEYSNVHSQGDSLEEARENIGLIMGDMIMHDEALPFEEKVEPEKYIKDIYGSEKLLRWILSDVNVGDYMEVEGANLSVRTNVSIKKGYKILAKTRKLNMSDFVNKALSKELGVEF